MRAAEMVWALAAVVPASAAGLMAGAILEGAGVSAKMRERAWSFAFWLGPAVSAVALAADALPQPATAEITVVLRGTPLGALSQAARALAQAPHIHMPGIAELLLGAVALGTAFRLMQLGRAWLALRALRQAGAPAPAETVRGLRAAGLDPSVPVRLSAGAATPIAAGLVRPEILLPQRFAEPEAAALVCRHEAEHIRRADNLRLLLEQLAGALLWFDPLRDGLHRRLLAAREERCDAAALADCTPEERELYARTLLEELTQSTSLVLTAGLTGAGRSHAVTRIRAILHPRPARARPGLTLGLCVVLAGLGGGMAWAASQATQPAPEWMGKVLSAVAAIDPIQPHAADDGAAVARPGGKGRGAAPRPTLVRIAGGGRAALPSGSAEPAGPGIGQTADTADLSDDMVMFVNGDMDTDELQHLVWRFATSRGLQPIADHRPQLEQAVLRSVAGEPRIDVEADSVQKFDGATVFAGNVEVTGDLKRAFDGASVEVDSRPLSKDMIPSSRLLADAVEFKRSAPGFPGPKFLSVNIHGVRVAQ